MSIHHFHKLGRPCARFSDASKGVEAGSFKWWWESKSKGQVQSWGSSGCSTRCPKDGSHDFTGPMVDSRKKIMNESVFNVCPAICVFHQKASSTEMALPPRTENVTSKGICLDTFLATKLGNEVGDVSLASIGKPN